MSDKYSIISKQTKEKRKTLIKEFSNTSKIAKLFKIKMTRFAYCKDDKQEDIQSSVFTNEYINKRAENIAKLMKDHVKRSNDGTVPEYLLWECAFFSEITFYHYPYAVSRKHNTINQAVALYILDILKKYDKLEEASKFFPSFEEAKKYVLLHTVYTDNLYNLSTVGGLMMLIDNNDVLHSRINKKSEEYVAAKKLDAKLKAIINLIPKQEIETAKKVFEREYYAYFNLLAEGACAVEQKCRNVIDSSLSDVKGSMDELDSFDLKTASLSLENIEKKIQANIMSYVFRLFHVTQKNYVDEVHPESKLSTKRIDIFSVSDLYVIAFAVFCLRFFNKPLYYSNITNEIYRIAGTQLPWGMEQSLIDCETEDEFELVATGNPFYLCRGNFELFDEWDKEEVKKTFDDNNSADCALYNERRKRTELTVPDNVSSCFYEKLIDYSEFSDKNPDHINAAQFLMSRTGIIPHRNMELYHNQAMNAQKYTDDPDTSLLGYCFGAMQGSAYQKKIDIYDEFLDESEIKTENRELKKTIETLQQDISKQKKDTKTVIAESYQNKKKCEELEARLKALEEEKDAAVKELAELRSMICPIDNTEKTVEFKIDFPYKTMLRHVVFGGATSWLKSMRYLLPNVRFVDPDTNPDLQLLKNADVVWFQSKVISHTYFGKVLDKCRLHNIDFQYLNFNSAEKCAEQLALYDIKKVEEDTNA